MRSPASVAGSGTSQARSAVATRMPAGTHAGLKARRKSRSSPDFKTIRPEADIAEPPALGALADVLGQLLLIHHCSFPDSFETRHRERFAVGHQHRCQLFLFG